MTATPKTYKMLVGGSWIRSESGRVDAVTSPDGTLVRVALGSRKDLRDAVVAARGSQPAWAAATPYLRGQILYRVAEMLNGRFDQFVAELAASGVDADAAGDEVEATIDCWVWWAGWADKLTQVLGSVNPVAGPFLNVSTPIPHGVVGVLSSEDRPLLSMSSVLAAAICTGNTAVVITPPPAARPVLTFGEVLATSDVPDGVVNLLVGGPDLHSIIAGHRDVDALDASPLSDAAFAELVATGADNMKRVVRTEGERSPETAAAFLDIRTVWHPTKI